MASRDDNSSRAVDVQILPAQPGSVTTLHGSGIATYPVAADTTAPTVAPMAPVSVSGGAAPGWQPWTPVVMPQPSVIVVTVDKGEAKKEKSETKATSEVFKRV